MNLLQLISDALYNRKLRKSGQERPGEIHYVPGWGPDWKPIDPYAEQHAKGWQKIQLVKTTPQKAKL